MENLQMHDVNEGNSVEVGGTELGGSWKPCNRLDLKNIGKKMSQNADKNRLAKATGNGLMSKEVVSMGNGEKTVGGEESGDNWERILKKLKTQLGNDIFNSWFKRLKFCRIESGVALHSVPTNFLKSWITSHYREKLLELWREENASVMRVDIVVRQPVASPKMVKQEEKAREEARKSDAASTGKSAKFFSGTDSASQQRRSEPMNVFAGSPIDEKHTFETFEQGSANRMACAAALTIADELSASRFNPLFIHAGVGQGKTHLLQAIAWRTRRQNPKVRVLYLTAEYFMWRFATAIRDKTALTLKESLRGIDILLIDDMQFLQGQAIQAEFCHLLNELIDSARQVVVAGDRPPSELESLDERVRSRLQGGVTLEIKTPDYELRKKILVSRYEKAKAKQPDLDIPEDILHYVARQISSSGRDIEGAFNQLMVHQQFSDGELSMEDIDRILEHLVKTRETNRVKIEDIQKIVARQFSVSRNDLLSSRRTRNIVRPRQIAMYLAKTMTLRSLPEIGRRFGGRDHTTVLHAVRKIEELTAQDQKLSREIELLKRLIEEE